MSTKILPITPMGAPRQTRADKWKERPVVLRYRAYKDWLNAELPNYVLPSVLKIEFHLPLSQSWSVKKKAAHYGQYHQQKPDIDNLVKGFMDAFHTDDAHVAVIHAGKYWCQEGEAPCIVLVLES
jgi:Holliday junction resolvase RusA-like endonuclease